MNKLRIGKDKSGLIPEGDCLLIHNHVPDGFKVIDVFKHKLNPLSVPKTDYERHRLARSLAEAFYKAAYPNTGSETLTVRNGERDLYRALRNGTRLDQLECEGEEAQGLMDDILQSPLIAQMFNTTNTALKGRTVVLLDRSVIDRRDARIIASVLVTIYPGQVVIPDFGFYAMDFHKELIDQERLIVGVNALAELDKEMQQMVLSFEEKHGEQCTFEDADTLAMYEGLVRGTNAYGAFVGKCMGTVRT